MSTPSPFTVTKDGCHFEVKVDAHYVSDEEMQMLRRHIANLKSENDGYAGQLTQLSLEVGLLRKKNTELLRNNDKLRELVWHLRECTRHNTCALCDYVGGICDFDYDMRELGVEP